MPRATKNPQKSKDKPTLIKVGDLYISPDNVEGFKRGRQGLYILQLRSTPETEHPLWITERELEKALPYFNVVGL